MDHNQFQWLETPKPLSINLIRLMSGGKTKALAIKEQKMKPIISCLTNIICFTILGAFSIAHAAEPAKKDDVPIIDIPDLQPKCPEQIQGNKIVVTLMVIAAAKNCKDYPLTEAQAEEELKKLNCNAKAATAIKNMRAVMLPQFSQIYTKPNAPAMCKQAAKHYIK